MSGTVQAVLAALSTVFAWPTILFVFLGALIGVVTGVIPGLGGAVAMVLLLPFTFVLSPAQAMVLLVSVMGGTAFGGSLTAILVNIPGTPPNTATCFDGYPMTKEGRADEAIGISATASALGAVFGLVIIVAMVPVARQTIFLFQPPEFFWLAVGGLTVVATVGRGNLYRSLVSAGFGLMLGFVGFQGQVTATRYTYDIAYLWKGISVLPLLIGLFAVTEAIRLGLRDDSIEVDEATGPSGDRRSWLDGVKHVLAHPVLFLRAAGSGTIIGMIPGVGGMLANFVAYAQAVKTSDDPDSFGRGNPSGVLASEASNDAKDAGAILPTVVLGIPGSVSMVVLLSGFLLHGVTPGRQLLNENLDILFTIIVALLITNLVVSGLGIVTSRYLIRITRLSTDLLVPFVLVFSVSGAYVINRSVGDVAVTLLFGLIGFAIVAFDYSRIAVVLGVILGPIAETAFHQSLAISNGDPAIFVTRPISLVLVALVVASLVVPPLRRARAA
ncbi:tricarboxylic transporter [Halobacteriales archaeon QS_1_68_20]|nr:MAG: tricarboxylic transporter [Halobacteriales archaeon QS_1_68_20]